MPCSWTWGADANCWWWSCCVDTAPHPACPYGVGGWGGLVQLLLLLLLLLPQSRVWGAGNGARQRVRAAEAHTN